MIIKKREKNRILKNMKEKINIDKKIKRKKDRKENRKESHKHIESERKTQRSAKQICSIWKVSGGQQTTTTTTKINK